ncbi:MAG: hypothetical protein ABFD86_00640 [Bryobacteraceae bacterium]
MELLWQMAAVGFVFLMLAGTLWWFRGRGMLSFRRPFAAGSTFRVMSAECRLHLSPQHALHLVRLGERGLLVATHAGGCTLIAEAPWRELAQGRALERAVQG